MYWYSIIFLCCDKDFGIFLGKYYVFVKYVDYFSIFFRIVVGSFSFFQR